MCFAFKHKDSHILLLLEDLHRIQSRFRDLEGLARRISPVWSRSLSLHLATPQTLESLNQACKTWFPNPIQQCVHHSYAFFGPKIKIFLPNKWPQKFRFVMKPFQFSPNLKT